jgi:hypothetical protein
MPGGDGDGDGGGEGGNGEGGAEGGGGGTCGSPSGWRGGKFGEGEGGEGEGGGEGCGGYAGGSGGSGGSGGIVGTGGDGLGGGGDSHAAPVSTILYSTYGQLMYAVTVALAVVPTEARPAMGHGTSAKWAKPQKRQPSCSPPALQPRPWYGSFHGSRQRAS